MQSTQAVELHVTEGGCEGGLRAHALLCSPQRPPAGLQHSELLVSIWSSLYEPFELEGG